MRQLRPGQLRNLFQDRITTGSITASVQPADNVFLITSESLDLFKIQSTGVVVLATQSIELASPAPAGGMYFTSGSFFVGLE